jgi:hypothetical protein
MTENQAGAANITDNLETQAQDAAASPESAITSPEGVSRETSQEGAVPTPEKFNGQDRDQILKNYLELEKVHTDLSEKSKQLENWCNRVGVFFKLDDQDRVTLNEDMVKAYAETRGWMDNWTKGDNNPQPNDQQRQPATQEPSKEQIMEQFENDPSSVIEKAVEKALEKRLTPLNETIQTTQQNLMNSQYQQWINEVRNENPKEFDELRMDMGKLINEHGLNDKVKNANDIRKILAWTKASTGRLVDKGQHEQQIQQLNQTLSILDPTFGTNSGRSDNPEASIDELLGGGTSPRGSEEQKVMKALLGKTALKP